MPNVRGGIAFDGFLGLRSAEEFQGSMLLPRLRPGRSGGRPERRVVAALRPSTPGSRQREPRESYFGGWSGNRSDTGGPCRLACRGAGLVVLDASRSTSTGRVQVMPGSHHNGTGHQLSETTTWPPNNPWEPTRGSESRTWERYNYGPVQSTSGRSDLP